MYNYLEFIEEVKANIQGILGGDAKITTKEVVKNNGVTYIGLLIQKGEDNVIPTIYMESFYRDYREGKELRDVIKEVTDVYYKSRHQNKMDMEFFSDYTKVKDKIAYKLIHYGRNKEILSQIPHIPYLNLAIVFYYICENDDLGRGTILIRNEYMKRWEVTTDILYKQASENMPHLLPCEWKTMEQIIMDMIGRDALCKEGIEFEEPDASAMYVLTNKTKIYGASCILYEGMLQKIWNKMGMNFYILPSSVHEVIIIPQTGNESAERLLNMVTEVNHTQVDEEEILADSVYFYSREKNYIEIAAKQAD